MQAKTIQKYSKSSTVNLKKTAKKWFHTYIKLRDTDENGYGNCIATGQKLRYGTINAQAGHYFSAGKYPNLEFNEDNVHLQSLSDNYFGHDFANYGTNLLLKIGDDRFIALSIYAGQSKRTVYKQDRFTLIDIIEIYKLKVKEISKTKNFKV